MIDIVDVKEAVKKGEVRAYVKDGIIYLTYCNTEETVMIGEAEKEEPKMTPGKETLIKYCQEHNGEEIYEFLQRVFDISLVWEDPRAFITEWLNQNPYKN